MTRYLRLVSELKAPFFVFFNLIDLHFPYHAPESVAFKFGGSRGFLEKITAGTPGVLEMELLSGARKIGEKPLAALYDAELNHVDFVIGKLVECLEGKGLYRECERPKGSLSTGACPRTCCGRCGPSSRSWIRGAP